MKPLLQTIKYEGNNQTLIWKSPIQDFSSGSQLIVHESQEAIFFMNGQALDLFGPGRHTLETQNLPLITKIMKKPFEKETPFHCEIYFVNKVEQMAIRWGTDSKVSYMEPNYNFPLSIGASGEMTLVVSDSRKLLVKLVGTETFLSQSALVGYFRSFLMSRVKPYLAKTMQESIFGIFEVDSRMDQLAESIHKQLNPDFDEYGVELRHFFILNIVRPEGEKIYERFKELHARTFLDVKEAELRQKVSVINQTTEAQKTIIESQAQATKRNQEGYSYHDERSFDVAEKVAANENSGGIANTGVGLGMLGGMALGVGSKVAGVTTDALSNVGSNGESDLTVKIEKLKILKTNGLINEDEFNVLKQQLIDEIMGGTKK